MDRDTCCVLAVGTTTTHWVARCRVMKHPSWLAVSSLLGSRCELLAWIPLWDQN